MDCQQPARVGPSQHEPPAAAPLEKLSEVLAWFLSEAKLPAVILGPCFIS